MSPRSLDHFFLVGLLAGSVLLWGGCDEQGSPMPEDDGPTEVQYELERQPNDGDFPLGRGGSVTFYDLGDDSTLVKLDLAASLNRRPKPGPPEVSFVGSINRNSGSQGGNREYLLSPIDARAWKLESARVVQEPFETFLDLDGHVQIRESVADTTVISLGNIGANGDGITSKSGLDLVADPRTQSFDLDAVSNEGRVAPEGISGTVRFRELTEGKTLVTVTLAPETASGRTEAGVAHPAHIHANRASEGGDIEFALGPISGNDAAARGSVILREGFGFFANFDGHVLVHQSNANRSIVLARGDIGANVPRTGSD